MKKIIALIRGHKIIFFFIIAVIALGGYFIYQKINTKENNISYLTAKVQRGILISSIFGTGQVSSLNQIEIKPKVSGNVVLVNIKNGQAVEQGELIFQVDSRDVARKINEAQAILENTKLELEELLAPIDNLTLIQAENSLADAEDSLIKLKMTQKNNYQETTETKQKEEDNLAKAYEDAYNSIAGVFLDLPGIVTGIYTVLYSNEISNSEPTATQNSNNFVLLNSISVNNNDKRNDFQKYLNSAEDNYKEAKDSYQESFDDYKNIDRYSEKTVIEKNLSETSEAVKKIADAVKSEVNMLDWWIQYRTSLKFDIYSDVAGYQSDLNSYTSKTNSHLSTLLVAQRSIDDCKKSILNAERDLKEMEQNNPLELAAAQRSIIEKQEKIKDLKIGATELEKKSKQLAVQQKQNSLLEAQQNYADYFIRAPFSGTIVEMNLIKGDDTTSGTALATLITNQKIAEITLNEIDAVQVKIEQKAVLAFDAVSDLSITGEVAEIDALGTVNSGVVSYNAKIAFDIDDERIKPGMTVSTSIILESKQNVLLVPLSAVKGMGDNSYVEVLVNGQPQRKTVVIGSNNDTQIEILSGIEEGEEVISQTINNSTTQNNGSTQIPTGGMSGGRQADPMQQMQKIMR